MSPASRRALARSRLSTLDALARDAGVHPELARRFVRLGLLEPRGGTQAAPLFRTQDAALLARAARLRRDLGVNYAGAVLAAELLARIDELEARERPASATRTKVETIAWTRIG
jgi:MerR HTH family regulatory protein